MVLFLISFWGGDEGQRNLFTVIQVRFIIYLYHCNPEGPDTTRDAPFQIFILFTRALFVAHSAAAEPQTTPRHTCPPPPGLWTTLKLKGWRASYHYGGLFFFFFSFLLPPLRWDQVGHPMLYGAWSGLPALGGFWELVVPMGVSGGVGLREGLLCPPPVLSSLSPSASLLLLHHTTPHAGP